MSEGDLKRPVCFSDLKAQMLFFTVTAVMLALACHQRTTGAEASSPGTSTNLKTFSARGFIRKIEADGRTVVIEHEAISNYMSAMVMPFNVKDPHDLAGLRAGDEISFQLQISNDVSWIERMVPTGKRQAVISQSNPSATATAVSSSNRHPLLDYKFTNELGQAMSLSQFDGQALAITFFFTRCPIPDFCPRLSKNFQEASQKLAGMTNAPPNWHLLSVSFDAEFDTPAVLKQYADQYHYDPAHWSFLTGSPDKIAELAKLSGITVEKEGSFFNHNFRTLIIDAAGHLQMSFPIGGNISDAIVSELLKGASLTNK